jgi:hypothetical protein
MAKCVNLLIAIPVMILRTTLCVNRTGIQISGLLRIGQIPGATHYGLNWNCHMLEKAAFFAAKVASHLNMKNMNVL